MQFPIPQGTGISGAQWKAIEHQAMMPEGYLDHKAKPHPGASVATQQVPSPKESIHGPR